MRILLLAVIALSFSSKAFSQDCKTDTELDAAPGKYLTAAKYPWPAVRAEYFKNMIAPADKATAKQTLEQIEKIEQQSHSGFNLTGGNWENYYSTDGYVSYGNARMGKYTFQSSLHEYFCNKGKLTRNDEASTILRVYVNDIPFNALNRFLQTPFGASMGDYDLGLQYADWKNHRPADVGAQLISLLTYITCNSQALMDAINSGKGYFQDVPEKEVKPNNRNNYVYRYWFVKKVNLPVLMPISRKEYLQSLLEYYEREKLYFPKLLDKLTKDHDAGVKQYSNWQADVNDKIAAVQKILSEQAAGWLAVQAVINRMEDASQTYKATLAEKTNHNRFWKFYDKENKSEPLYKYNPEYFKATAPGAATPQFISVAFRYITMPSSIRLLNNFTKNFDFGAITKLVE
jgi:hypothetical protein